MTTVEVEENQPLIGIDEKIPNIYICITGELTIDSDLREARKVSSCHC